MIQFKMKEVGSSLPSSSAAGPHTINGMAIAMKPFGNETIIEDSGKNYITLVGNRELHQKVICQSAVRKTDAKKENNFKSNHNHDFKPQGHEQTWLPLSFHNPNLFTGYPGIIVPPEKRGDTYFTFEQSPLAPKLTTLTQRSNKSDIMKEIKAFKQNVRCPVCNSMTCTCIMKTEPLMQPPDNNNNTRKGSLPSFNSSLATSITALSGFPVQVESFFPPSSNAYYQDANGAAATASTAASNTVISTPASTIATAAPVPAPTKRQKKTSNPTKPQPNIHVIGRTGQKTTSSERTCGVCGLVFASHRDVILHNRTHTEKTKDFGCHLCGKYFAQRTTLKQHLVIHSGEKNFSCDVCGKRFALKIYLRTHKKSCH